MKSIMKTRAIAFLTAFALLFAVALPTLGIAGAPAPDKKENKSKHNHDARDVRWDDDDDDWRRRDRDRDDRRIDRREVRRRALAIGYSEGFQAGRQDRFRRLGFNVQRHHEYRDATKGFRRQFGSVEFYRINFREGFREGYRDGYLGRRGRIGIHF